MSCEMQDLLAWIEKNGYGSEAEKKALSAYVTGETEEKPNISQWVFYSYELNSGFLEHEDTKKALGRFLHWMIEKYPTRAVENFMHVPDKIHIYKETEIPESFIEQDLKRAVTWVDREIIWNFMPWYESLVRDVLDEYPEIARRWTTEFERYAGEKQMAALLFCMYTVKFGRYQSEDGGKAFWERIIYSVLLTLAPLEKVKKLMEHIHEEKESIVFLETVKPFSLQIEGEYKNTIAVLLGFSGYGISPVADDGVRVVLTIVPPENVYRYYYDWDRHMRFMQEYHLPVFAQFKFLAYYVSMMYPSKKQWRISIQKLKKLFVNSREFYLNFMKALFAERETEKSSLCRMGESDCLANALLAVVLTEEPEEGKKYLPDAERGILTLLSRQADLHNEFGLPDGMSVEELTKPDFPVDCIEKIQLNDSTVQEICRAGMYLYGYSTLGKNIMKIVMEKQKDAYFFYRLGFLEKAGVFCPVGEKEKYSYFHERLGISLERLSKIYVINEMLYNGEVPEEEKTLFLAFLQKHKQEAEEGIATFLFDGKEMTAYLELLYGGENGFDSRAILKAFYRKSKPVADFAESVLQKKEAEVRLMVEEMRGAKSKQAADAAFRLIRLWDNDKIEKELDKIQDVSALSAYIEGLYTKSNERSLPYVKEISYSGVRVKDSEEPLPPVLLKYYISEYMLLKEVYLITSCKKIQGFANPYDLRAFVKQLFELWISEGATAKYKNLLLPFALTAGESQIIELKKQIDVWADNSKPALAAFGVQALCMNGSKIALSTVDTMAKKHKNKRVKSAALEAMDIAAREWGISREELDDKIVPDLGFQKNRERIFSYGKREFKAVLSPKMEVLLYDDVGKAIKSLPKAAAKYEDDEDKAAAAKEALKAVKKQLKTIIDTQKPRMFQAVLTQRRWTADKWKELFLENPIMTEFATELIWEERNEQGELLGTFRYMEDGTMNTAEEEEYTLSEHSSICLLHPVDVSDEVLELWKEQLADYEIIQSVNQLSLPVYHMKPEEEEACCLTMFQGKKVYGATLKAIAGKVGLPVEYTGAGEIVGILGTDASGKGAFLLRTSSFYTGDYNAETTLKEITFIESASDRNKVPLKLVPAKLISLALYVGRLLEEKAIQS